MTDLPVPPAKAVAPAEPVFVPPAKTVAPLEPVIAPPTKAVVPAEPVFVPPAKAAAPAEPVVIPLAETAVPLDPVVAVSPAQSVTTQPVAGDLAFLESDEGTLVDRSSLDTGIEAESGLELALEADALPLERVIAPIDTVFFYGYSATSQPTLYQVNLEQGSLAAVTEPTQLFPTVLNGLFTAEEWGLDGAEAGTEAPLQTFSLLGGNEDKNFLIGNVDSNALFGFGSDDLILTSRGQNLAFGGIGNDTLVAGEDDNGLFGGAGDDALEGGAGDDLLMGGTGNDILSGGAGVNTLIGGAGADIFRLDSPGAYTTLVDTTEAVIPEPDTIVDFSVAEGDHLDFSLITAQPLFVSSGLLPYVSFMQVGADTHVQITTPLGQVSTEAILLNVQSDTLAPTSLTFTTPSGAPLLK
ncbi:MAG: type I secretion C-terminal target domain-containing protein [Nodosilinea sp.]